MKLCAFACCAASAICSWVAFGTPYAMFSATVPSNNTTSKQFNSIQNLCITYAKFGFLSKTKVNTL